MKATWVSIRAVSQVTSPLAAVAGLVLVLRVIYSFFTGNTEGLTQVAFLMCLFSLPAASMEVPRSALSPEPRPSPRLILARWPLLLLAFMIPAFVGWAVWFGFGSIWMGALVTLGEGLPMIALLASDFLMEPGPRKDRAYLAFTVAMLAAQLLMIVAFALVYGRPGE